MTAGVTKTGHSSCLGAGPWWGVQTAPPQSSSQLVLQKPHKVWTRRSSNSGFHCNQRGFQPFLWLKQLTKILCSLSTFSFSPSLPLFFPCLAGGKRNAWLEFESWWWCGPFLPWEAMKSHFPQHTRNQRARKAFLAHRAKCHFQTALGLRNFPLEFLSSCAYSGLVFCFLLLFLGCGHAPGTSPTATSTRYLPSPPRRDGVRSPTKEGHLRPTLHRGGENPCPEQRDLPIANTCQQEKKTVQHCLWSGGFQ